MTVTIAVAGKGGTGKTTLCGLLVRYIVENRGGKILAIDGKTARRSFSKKKGMAALHLVTAWATENGSSISPS